MVDDREDTLERAVELELQAYDAFKSGDAERSRELVTESLALAREVGDAAAVARALAGLMRLALRAGDRDGVERLAEECDAVAEDAGDRALGRLPLHMRAEAARMAGDLERARELYDRSIALNRELGNTAMVAVELANKSWVEINSGRLDEAERLGSESLDLTPDDDAYGNAFALLVLARVQLERGEARGAETLAAAEALLERDGVVWDPADEPEHERTARLAERVAGPRPSAADDA